MPFMSDTQQQSGNGMSSHMPSVLLIPANADDPGALDRTLASIRSAAWLSHDGIVIWPYGHDSQSASALQSLEQVARQHFSNAVVRGALGFDATIIESSDILLVAAGCVVPEGWDARLQIAARSFSRAGAVSALEGRDIAAAVAARNEAAPDAMQFDLANVDAAAFALGDRAVYDSPLLNSACAYLRNDALRALAVASGSSILTLLADFPSLHARLTFSGWRVCVADFCVVSAGPEDSPVASHPDPEVTRIFAALNPLDQLVSRVADFVRQVPVCVPKPGFDERPVVLHVLHSWGGGVQKWVHDFCAGDASRIHMLLTSVQVGSDGTQRIRLAFADAPDAGIREWDLAIPIRSISPGSLEYERILQEVLCDFSVDAIVVSSLIGHSLAVLEQDVRTLWICHDYLPLCQSIFPFFGNPCARCTVEDLGRCQRENPLNIEFRAVAPNHWDALRKRFVDILLARRPAIVAPSRSVIEGMKKLDARMGSLDIKVIPHGIDSPSSALPWAARESGDKLRLVLLGRVNALKGEQILRDLAPMLTGQIELTLVGCGPRGEQLAAKLGLRAVPSYRVEELAEILRGLAPHAGLLLSTFPETFSYTLSELQALGVPPIATRLGAFEERIEHGKTGFLFEPSAASLKQMLDQLQADPHRLTAVATTLRNNAERRSVADMVADYERLLPARPLEKFRFRVGRGSKTAILADYAHLASAYRSLHESYDQLEAAYKDTEAAYQSTRDAYESACGREAANLAELTRIGRLVNELAADVGQLNLSRRWWRAPHADRMVSALVEKMAKPANAPAEPDGDSGT